MKNFPGEFTGCFWLLVTFQVNMPKQLTVNKVDNAHKHFVTFGQKQLDHRTKWGFSTSLDRREDEKYAKNLLKPFFPQTRVRYNVGKKQKQLPVILKM